MHPSPSRTHEAKSESRRRDVHKETERSESQCRNTIHTDTSTCPCHHRNTHTHTYTQWMLKIERCNDKRTNAHMQEQGESISFRFSLPPLSAPAVAATGGMQRTAEDRQLASAKIIPQQECACSYPFCSPLSESEGVSNAPATPVGGPFGCHTDAPVRVSCAPASRGERWHMSKRRRVCENMKQARCVILREETKAREDPEIRTSKHDTKSVDAPLARQKKSREPQSG